jgi:alpha-1,2-mannosyltransferase
MCTTLVRLGNFLGSRRGRYGALLAAAIGGAVWIVWVISLLARPGFLDLAGNIKGADFVEFYVAGRIVATHQADRLYDLDLQSRIEHELAAPQEWSGFHGFITPPFFALPFVPLSALPYFVALALWSGLGVLLLAGCPWLLRRAGTGSARSLPVLWTLAFVPVFAAVSYGQNSLLSLFVLAVVFVLLGQARDGPAGLVLGLLLYKPQLVLVLALLLALERRWSALLGLAATGAALVLVSLCMSLPAARAYVRLASSFPLMLADPAFPTWKMHSLYSFFVLLLPGHLGLAAGLATLSSAVVLLAVRALQPPYRSETLHRWFAVAVWGSVLVSPHVPLYDLSLLVLPAGLLHAERRDEALWRGGIAAIWAATIVSQPLARALRAGLGPSLQLSVPVIAAVGYCLLRKTAGPPDRGAHRF